MAEKQENWDSVQGRLALTLAPLTVLLTRGPGEVGLCGRGGGGRALHGEHGQGCRRRVWRPPRGSPSEYMTSLDPGPRLGGAPLLCQGSPG